MFLRGRGAGQSPEPVTSPVGHEWPTAIYGLIGDGKGRPVASEGFHPALQGRVGPSLSFSHPKGKKLSGELFGPLKGGAEPSLEPLMSKDPVLKAKKPLCKGFYPSRREGRKSSSTFNLH